MEFIKNDFDYDRTLKKLDESKNAYNSIRNQITKQEHSNYMLYLLYNLLKTPKKSLIENLLLTTQDNLLSFIDTLKLIVKSKFMFLNCQDNIIKIVNLLDKSVGAKEIIETLVINCLRYASYSDAVSKLDVYSDFITFFTKSDVKNNYNVFGKDYNFENTCENILNGNTNFSQYCNFQTQKQFLVTKICPNLEFNLIFYLEKVHKHYEIYEKWLLSYYIINPEIAKNVIRYLVAVYFTKNINNLLRLIYLIFHNYKNEYVFISIFYDTFLYCHGEPINVFLIEIILDDMNKHNLFYPFFVRVLSNSLINKKFTSFLKASKQNVRPIMEHYNLLKTAEIETIIQDIEMMNFDSYFEIIMRIEQMNKPFIKFEFYDKLIESSMYWDGYMQVFLWKIFAYQKIYFGYLPECKILQTSEAKDGYKILQYL